MLRRRTATRNSQDTNGSRFTGAARLEHQSSRVLAFYQPTIQPFCAASRVAEASAFPTARIPSSPTLRHRARRDLYAPLEDLAAPCSAPVHQACQLIGDHLLCRQVETIDSPQMNDHARRCHKMVVHRCPSAVGRLGFGSRTFHSRFGQSSQHLDFLRRPSQGSMPRHRTQIRHRPAPRGC